MSSRAGRRWMGVSTLVAVMAVAVPAHAGQAVEPLLLKNRLDTSLCLGVKQGDTARGTRLILWDCKKNVHADQGWSLNDAVQFDGGDYGALRWERLWTFAAKGPPDSSAKCIAMENNGWVGWRNHAIIWDCAASEDQAFTFVPTSIDADGDQCWYIINLKGLKNGADYLYLGANAVRPGGEISLQSPWAGAEWCAASSGLF